MKRNKLLALLLSFMMLFTVSPAAYAEEAPDGTTIETADSAPMDDIELPESDTPEEMPEDAFVDSSAGESADIMLTASSSWQPKPNRTVSSASAFPITLNNGDVLQINGPIEFSASTGQSPIKLASGASAKIIINGSVTLRGANASGTTGATAAIHVPEGAILIIYSAHDEELSTSTAAPKDTLTVTGGNAAPGTNGGNAIHSLVLKNSTYYHNWYTGGGGNGGGGAAAAIGGNGGTGGIGAAKAESPVEFYSNVWGHHHSKATDDNHGAGGVKGGSGSQGESTGIIYISGRLNLNATGGAAARGGDGGAGSSGFANIEDDDTMIGGCGGGGGGGGGLSAPAFGAGGAGGSGGGSGGMQGSDHHGNVQGPGGGGGGGGWPNGGGGGGGGAECTSALDEMDNKSQGGAGGSGGAAGHAGSSGSAGTQTGTEGHGLNDARPGNGGSGGPGVGTEEAQASGGSGGKEKDDKDYNGGDGGLGGKSVPLRVWHIASNLILSTAANINTHSSWGDGGGQGSVTALDPYVIYDLMDCQITLNPRSYTYTGRQLKPIISSISYSSASDRDGQSVSNVARNLSSSNYSLYGYGENIHCPTGTVIVMGLTPNSSRTTITTNGSVIGHKTVTFTINKATLTAPIALSLSTPYVGQTFTASLSTYTSSTAGSDNLSSLLRASTGKAEGPKVNWSLAGGAGQCTEQNGLNAQYVLSSTATGTIQATLTDMNDFNDCKVTVTATSRQTQPFTATLSTDTPHPRIAVSVTLPQGITSPTYQWYVDGIAINGATGATYAPTAGDIGKKLSVVVTPDAATGYGPSTAAAKNPVEAHRYTTNGFCTVCGEYQPATLSNGVYQIANGGQMFWFASLINGDKIHAEFSVQNKAASGTLSANIDLENREWAPMMNFSGTFDGASHTVSKFQITRTASYVGFFGSISGGTVRGFTLEGEITLSGSEEKRIGGAVGSANGGAISQVTSAVHITNADNVLHHVGGVIGGIDNGTTTVEQCLFTGSIQVSASTDCIGGIVGYSNAGARISHCANLGTVTATAEGAYVGGILGYVKNVGPSIRNSYNYGTVASGGGNYCGAIVGWLRNHTAANYTDNYYLAGSAPSGFGSGSQGTSAVVTAKEEEAFQSGEVCYLVNGRSSEESVIWRQDIDNGQTPYDSLPVFAGGIVYQNEAHHDCTANQYQIVYSNSVMEKDHINHHYVNGFCACCDVREPAQAVNGVYQITNGGQLYWFAAQVNSGAIPQNSAASLTGDIELEGNHDGSAAGFEGIKKDRNFPCIGITSRPYQGTFSGNGHTVSTLFISRNEKVDDIGMFGAVNGAAISQMTVNGQINLYTAAEKDIQHVGGIVGSADNSRLSGLTSYVGILGNGAETPHIGGVVEEALYGSTVFQCMYFGYIQIQNTTDCVGGVAGYINDSTVSYCANHGTVTTGAAGGYTGGVVGYLNNSGGSVKNCYNYGPVANGGGAHCGAIIGWLRGHTAASLTDNYYLTDSAPAAFGSGSASTSASAPAKEKASFISGEVCYLVNSKTSTGGKALWKQDIDNGNTPYDTYPIFEAAAVYYHSDGLYSNDPEKVSVTITWGDMTFDYHEGRWDPDTHQYSGGWSPLTTGGNNLTVQNNSNVALAVSFAFQADAAFTQYDLTGTFNGVAAGANRMERGGSLSAQLTLKSLNPGSLKDQGQKKIGQVTVSLTTIGGE